MMKTTHEAPITNFVVRWNLNPGLSDARESADWTREFPGTRAGLALGLDWVDHENISLAGRYGSARCALYAVAADGEVEISENGEPDTITESRAEDLLTADGELDADDVHSLREPVWDGHNHVQFSPSRSLALLTGEDRYERAGHVLLDWNSDGGIDDIRIDEGWTIVDEEWGNLGNQSWAYDLDVEAHEKALTLACVEYDRVDASDDDIMILVKNGDLERAQEALQAAVYGPDDD